MDWADDDFALECDETFDDDDDMDLIADEELEEEEEEEEEEVGASRSLALSAEAQNRVALEDRDLEYAFCAMLRKELDRPDFTRGYEYVKYRRVLVDWMSDVGESHLGMHKVLVHAGVALLERVLARDAPLPPKSCFELLALTCMRVAAKFGGVEAELAPAMDFYGVGEHAYSFDAIANMEIFVCQETLDWKLSVVTPLHFLQLFMNQTVLFSDDEILGSSGFIDEARSYYGKYTDFFIDLALQEYNFQAYRPSVVAAATLAAARKAMGVSPLWREELSVVSGYSAEQVEPCFTALWTHYVVTFGKGEKREEESPACVTELWP